MRAKPVADTGGVVLVMLLNRPKVLHTGALAGVEAKLLVVPRNTPHIWALSDKLVVTIAGDLSAAELVAVAESLAQR